jgi:hypothetical protein
MVISDTGANITGTANVSGNANVGNLGTATAIATTAANVANLNANGNVEFTGANVSLGAVGNLHITGGSNLQYLQTDGAGNLSWASGSSGSSISNGNSNVNIATANGNVTISAVGNANIVTVTGTGANISGYANVTGNILGNGYASFVGSFTESQAATAGLYVGYAGGTPRVMFATGNTSQTFEIDNDGGNLRFYQPGSTKATIYPNGDFTASGTVTGGNLVTGGTANITGNANVGNVGTATLIATTAANVANLSANGNVAFTGANVSLGAVGNLHITGGTANYLLQTDGAGNLSWVSAPGGTSLVNGNSNIVITANGNVSTSVAGNVNVLVVTGTGANVTGIIYANGNIQTGGYLVGGAGNVGGDFYIGNLANIRGDAVVAGNGNITAVNTGLIQNGNSNIAITANANITFTAKSNATLVISDTNANITGGIGITQGVLANSLTSNGNITASGNLRVTVDSILTGNANVTGNINANILSASGNVAFTGANVSLGAVGNLHITGGSNLQVLTTDGAGNLSWGLSVGSSISNGNSNISIATANGNINISAVGNANVLQITGTGVRVTGSANISVDANIVGNLAVSGVAGLNDISAGGNIVASGNITSSSGGLTGLSLIVTGNANVARLNANSNVSFTGANVSLGAVGNLSITGGTDGYALITDGTGNLSWSALGGSAISNGTSNVRIATSGGNVRFNIGGTDVMDVASNRVDVKSNATMYFGGGGATIAISAGLNSGDPASLVGISGNISIIPNAGSGLLTVTGTKGISMNGPMNATGADVRQILTSNSSANGAYTDYINDGGKIAEIGVYSSTQSTAPNKLVLVGDAAGTVIGTAGNIDLFADSGNSIANAIANGTYSMRITYGSGGGNVLVKSNFVANSGVYFPSVAEETTGNTPVLFFKNSDGSGNVGFDSTIFYNHDTETLNIGNLGISDTPAATGVAISTVGDTGAGTLFFNMNGNNVISFTDDRRVKWALLSYANIPNPAAGSMIYNNDVGNAANGFYLCADGSGGASWDKIMAAKGGVVVLPTTGTPPTAVAGGIYYTGTAFKMCADGATWQTVTLS